MASDEDFQESYSTALAQQLQGSSMASTFQPSEQPDPRAEVSVCVFEPWAACLGESVGVEGRSKCESDDQGKRQAVNMGAMALIHVGVWVLNKQAPPQP